MYYLNLFKTFVCDNDACIRCEIINNQLKVFFLSFEDMLVFIKAINLSKLLLSDYHRSYKHEKHLDYLLCVWDYTWFEASQVTLVVKNPPASAG